MSISDTMECVDLAIFDYDDDLVHIEMLSVMNTPSERLSIISWFACTGMRIFCVSGRSHSIIGLPTDKLANRLL